MNTEGYSYDEDRRLHKAEQRRKRNKIARTDNYEPRQYTKRDDAFARRLNMGTRMLTGGNDVGE
jgi:hypothetical protein